MSRVLVLSAHESQLDRRIVAEANALDASGREVTLLSVPTLRPVTGLDAGVRLLVEPGGRFESDAPARGPAHRLPPPLRGLAKSLWYRFGSGPAPHNTAYFLRNDPKERFDAIHCHDAKTLPAAAALRARNSPEAKLIYDAHELFAFQSPERAFQVYWKRLEGAFIGGADLVITVNDSIARALAEMHGIAPPRVLYNSYGAPFDGRALDPEAFAAHFGAPPLRPGEAAVLFQGNLSAGRNLRALVDAFRRLAGRARLFLLGDGSERVRLEARAARGAGNVHFGGWVEQERLLGFVAAADLCVIPYRGERILNHRYCTPNKLFECIATGTPVCASDLPELRRIAAEGGVGAVYPMRSAAEIAAAIRDCLSRAERGNFTRDAFEAARRRTAWSAQAAKLLAWYDELGL